MSNQSKTTTTAKAAAREDATPTGPANIPGTKPAPGVKPRLSPEEKAKRTAETLANHERLIQARTDQILHFLKDMGISSLCGRITEYTDVSSDYIEASLLTIEERVAACRAAAKARSASAPVAARVSLREVAAKLQAQRQGTPAVGQTVSHISA